MSLFLSSYENRLDTKGRISVPASFRASLAGENFSGVVLYRSFTNNCIEGLSMSRMEQMATAADKMGVFDSELDDLSAMLFADARPFGKQICTVHASAIDAFNDGNALGRTAQHHKCAVAPCKGRAAAFSYGSAG